MLENPAPRSWRFSSLMINFSMERSSHATFPPPPDPPPSQRKKVPLKTSENAVYSMWDPDKRNRIDLQTHSEERDLGVFVDNQLKFHSHIRNVVCKSNTGLGLLKRSITSRSPKVFLKHYKAIIRPNLGFGNCIAAPQCKDDTRLLEGVQRRATKVIDGLIDLSYCERLKKNSNYLLWCTAADEVTCCLPTNSPVTHLVSST